LGEIPQKDGRPFLPRATGVDKRFLRLQAPQAAVDPAPGDILLELFQETLWNLPLRARRLFGRSRNHAVSSLPVAASTAFIARE
jgi:hypothetical protein